jgi:hypothetical protein
MVSFDMRKGSLIYKALCHPNQNDLEDAMHDLVQGQVASKSYMVLATMAGHHSFRLASLNWTVDFPRMSINMSIRDLLDAVQTKFCEGPLHACFPDFSLQPDGLKTVLFHCLVMKHWGQRYHVNNLPTLPQMEIIAAPLSSMLHHLYTGKTQFNYPTAFGNPTGGHECFTVRLGM